MSQSEDGVSAVPGCGEHNSHVHKTSVQGERDNSDVSCWYMCQLLTHYTTKVGFVYNKTGLRVRVINSVNSQTLGRMVREKINTRHSCIC